MSPTIRLAHCRTTAAERAPGSSTEHALGGVAGCVLLLVIAALAAVGGGVTASASSAGGVTVTGSGVGPLFVAPGDTIAAGWGVSLPEDHRPQVVSLSAITATIGLVCADGSWRGATSLVIHLPPTAVTIPENATGWLPTSDPATPAGFQALATVPPACGSVTPLLVTGVAYTATLTSVDVTDAFAVRFHALDAPRGHADGWDGDGDDHTPYGGCDGHTWSWDSPPCVAWWTAAITVHAAAPPAMSSRSPTPAPRPGPGSTSGSGSPPGRPARGSSPPLPATAAPRAAAAVGVPSAAAGPAPRASISPPAPPALVPLRPQTSAVLGPVPLMAPPVIGSAVAQLAPALPWAWFAALAIVDSALVVGLVVRSRRRRAGTLGGR